MKFLGKKAESGKRMRVIIYLIITLVLILALLAIVLKLQKFAGG